MVCLASADAGRGGPVDAGAVRHHDGSGGHGMRPKDSNPCRGIRRYRRKGRERFLSDDDIRRLSARLDAHESGSPRQVAVIRLLLLTGCRKKRTPHPAMVRLSRRPSLSTRLEDGAEDRDGSANPPAPFSMRSRRSRQVFPGPRADRPASAHWLSRFWNKVRAEAELDDLRLHDLRHAHASFALRQGENVLVIGRLLGHRRAETALKYTHPADAMARNAVETVGAVLGN